MPNSNFKTRDDISNLVADIHDELVNLRELYTTPYTNVYYDELHKLPLYYLTEIADGVSIAKLTDNNNNMTFIVTLSKHSKVAFHKHPHSDEIIIALAGDSTLLVTKDMTTVEKITQPIADKMHIPRDMYHGFDIKSDTIQYVIINKVM